MRIDGADVAIPQARPMRLQSVRQKRAAIHSAPTQEVWTLHGAEQPMLKAADQHIEQVTAVLPKAARARAGGARDQRMADDVSRNYTNSHGVAFETCMIAHPWDRSDKYARPCPRCDRRIALGGAGIVRGRSRTSGLDRLPLRD